MSYFNRLTSSLLAAALLAQSGFAAFAADTSETPSASPDVQLFAEDTTVSRSVVVDEADNGTASIDTDVSWGDSDDSGFGEEIDYEALEDYVFEGDTLPCSQNDPSYQKIMNSPAMLAAWGSGNLVHQKRFDGTDKVYGIDVSYYQYNIDWDKVKAAGIKYAIIRVGYRGYGNGQLVLDDRFSSYLKGAKAAGLDVGVYFYTQAINTTEAKEEAQFVLNHIKGYELEMPVYYDIEGVDYDSGRLDEANLSKTQKTALCTAFCDTIKNAGYDAGVYANKSWLTYQIDGAGLAKKYPVWLAHYTTETDYTGNFDMWQYTGMGSVSGIAVYVDMNVRYVADTSVDTPSSLKVTAVNASKGTLKWNVVQGADGYTVYRRNITTGVQATAADVSTNSASVTVYPENKQFFVKAYKVIGGKKYYSEASNVITLQANKVLNVSIVSRTDTSIKLKWTAVSGAKGYEVRAYNRYTKKYAPVKYTSTASIDFTGLEQASVYEFTVRAYTDSAKTQFGGYSDGVRYGTYAAKVSGVKYLSHTTSSVRVSWESNKSGRCAYEIALYNASNGTRTIVGTTENTSFNITGLKAGNKYLICVRAYYVYGTSKILGYYSSNLTAAAQAAAPTGLYCKSRTETSCVLAWKAVNGAAYYSIYEVLPTGIRVIGSSSKNEFTANFHDNLKSHVFYVVAEATVDGVVRQGVASERLTVYNGADAPKTFTVEGGTASAVRVSWNKVADAEKYWVYLAQPGSTNFIKVGETNSTEWLFSGLKAESDYKMKVRSVRDGAAGDYSAEFSVSTKAAIPRGFSVKGYNADAVRIGWNKVPGAVSYKVYMLDTKTNTYVLKGTASTEEYRFSGLKANTAYTVKVRAVYKRGDGATSAAQTVATRPSTPSGFKYTANTNTSVTLKWNAVSGASFYRIYMYDNETATYQKVKDVRGSTSCVITGLEKGSRYRFMISAARTTGIYTYYSLRSAAITSATAGTKYYQKTPYTGNSLYQGLVEIGVYSTYALQQQIAKVNALGKYTGTAEQNTLLLTWLKKGLLIMPS